MSLAPELQSISSSVPPGAGQAHPLCIPVEASGDADAAASGGDDDDEASYGPGAAVGAGAGIDADAAGLGLPASVAGSASARGTGLSAFGGFGLGSGGSDAGDGDGYGYAGVGAAGVEDEEEREYWVHGFTDPSGMRWCYDPAADDYYPLLPAAAAGARAGDDGDGASELAGYDADREVEIRDYDGDSLYPTRSPSRSISYLPVDYAGDQATPPPPPPPPRHLVFELSLAATHLLRQPAGTSPAAPSLPLLAAPSPVCAVWVRDEPVKFFERPASATVASPAATAAEEPDENGPPKPAARAMVTEPRLLAQTEWSPEPAANAVFFVKLAVPVEFMLQPLDAKLKLVVYHVPPSSVTSAAAPASGSTSVGPLTADLQQGEVLGIASVLCSQLLQSFAASPDGALALRLHGGAASLAAQAARKAIRRTTDAAADPAAAAAAAHVVSALGAAGADVAAAAQGARVLLRIAAGATSLRDKQIHLARIATETAVRMQDDAAAAAAALAVTAAQEEAAAAGAVVPAEITVPVAPPSITDEGAAADPGAAASPDPASRLVVAGHSSNGDAAQPAVPAVAINTTGAAVLLEPIAAGTSTHAEFAEATVAPTLEDLPLPQRQSALLFQKPSAGDASSGPDSKGPDVFHGDQTATRLVFEVSESDTPAEAAQMTTETGRNSSQSHAHETPAV
jgi:hypothetical protein